MADSHRFVVADVFTSTPLAGNQLAVFTDARRLDGRTMQALALEIGFSETVFVLPAAADGTARIRIFNPRHEMPFATFSSVLITNFTSDLYETPTGARRR